MIINDLPLIMLKCLLCTIIIEVIIAIIFGIRGKKDILNVILVNIVTNPLVTSIPVFINIKYGILERHIVLFVLEIFTLVFEASIYKKYLDYKKIKPFLVSLILNLGSYILGLLINLI